MSEPGTKVTTEAERARVFGGVTVTERVTRWNNTDLISVDYEANGVNLWEDEVSQTSFDSTLTTGQLWELLERYNIVSQTKNMAPPPPSYRLYFGAITQDALERIMKNVRAECDSDELAWYVLDSTQVGAGDHPRNPGHKWVEVEGAE